MILKWETQDWRSLKNLHGSSVTNAIGQSHACEAYGFLSSQETPCILGKTDCSLHCLQQPASCPSLDRMNPVHTLSSKSQRMTELLFWNLLSPVCLFAVLLSLNWDLKVILNSLGRITSLPLGSPPFNWVINQIDEDDLEDLWRDCLTSPKQVYQGRTREGWWWWWRCLFAFSSGCSRSGLDESCVD